MISQLHGQYERGETTPTEVVEAIIRSIDLVNGTLHAYTFVDRDGARRLAAQQTEYLRRGGKIAEAGKMFGIPVAVKDLDNVIGMPTSFGTLLFKDNVATVDSVPIERLKKAGAIIIGKTSSPIFGSKALSKNRVDGSIRNPWDLTRTTGGSSSGSASAVASGLTVLASGTDGGGSIRIPAAFCGCFGFKPTFGLVPQSGGLAGKEMQQFSNLTHHGPISRSVVDAAVYLDVTAGYHPSDPLSLPRRAASFADPLVGQAAGPQPPAALAGLRVAFCIDVGYGMASIIDPAVAENFRGAVGQFAAACGLTNPPEELATLNFPDVGAEWFTLSAAQHYGWYHDHPLVVGKEDQLEKPFVAAYRRAASEFNLDVLVRLFRLRSQLNRILAQLFERFDVLLTPSLPHTAWYLDKPLPRTDMALVGYSTPFNSSGLPAATVRSGLHRENGLPIGLQIVCDRHQDALVLSCALAFEQRTKCHSEWPSTDDIVARIRQFTAPAKL